jgi:DNA polymerase III subunit gamma/tau
MGSLQAGAEKDAPVKDTAARQEDFTKEAFEKCWAEFKETKRNLVAEHQVLTQPIDIEGTTVKISLTNPAQDSLLNAMKLELITYLRDSLNNDKILVEGILRPIEDQKMIYSADEKLEFLANKNPEIRELTKRFGLDPDF